MKGEYTISEVSELLKVSTRTIHSYIKKGKLKAHKENNKLYFPREQFIHQDQEYLFNNEEEATQGKQEKAQKTDILIQELRDKIKSLEEDKLYFKEQVRIEQSLRRDDIEKISKVLQLNYLPKEETKVGVYEGKFAKGEGRKKKKEISKNKKKKKKKSLLKRIFS